MELNDPSIMMAVKKDTHVEGSNVNGGSQISSDDLSKFFQDIKKRSENRLQAFDSNGFDEDEIVDENGEKAIISDILSKLPPFDADYKLDSESTKKQYNYSMNELLFIKEIIPEDYFEEVGAMLPKKKFWRLTGRFGDGQNANNNNGANAGQANSNKSSNRNVRNANNSHGTRPLSGEQGPYGRRNSKGRIRGVNSNKKSNKFNKNDKYVEENDIKVNNNDLMELEAEFQPTGNSMADFETWKAKMKEMENKKKGIITEAENPSSDAHYKESLKQTGSSSISNFLKMSSNSKTNESLENNQPSSEGNLNNESNQDTTVSGSSRFSSFFTSAPSNTSGAEELGTSDSLTKTSSSTSTSMTNGNGGSRLMSFFKNDSRPGTPSNSGVSTQVDSKNNKHSLPHPQSSHNAQNTQDQVSVNLQPQQQHILPQQGQPSFAGNQMNPMQRYPMPSQPPVDNSNFFQGLLNKGKSGEEMNMPTGMRIPNRPNGSQQMPMNPPPGFPMGMPPPHMMPPPGFAMYQGQPQNLPNNNGVIPGDNMKGNAKRQPQGQNPQFARGPISPNFPANMPFPPNMMRGNVNQYYPPMPQQSGMNNFMTQNGSSGKQQ